MDLVAVTIQRQPQLGFQHTSFRLACFWNTPLYLQSSATVNLLGLCPMSKTPFVPMKEYRCNTNNPSDH
ncbi:hypothetical protein GmHk_02G004161 [Glycine max]|nr:hypothetical protein GmHk_02G004161 [Glycine max]